MATPTASPTIAFAGPEITYLGLTRFDGSLLQPSGVTNTGVNFFVRPVGAAFSIVVEGKPGASGAALGVSTYQADLTDFPDLQILASRDLGNGSTDVCDRTAPTLGGVPAGAPPDFSAAQIAMANDLGCRFVDGAGESLGRGSNDACVQYDNGDFGFADPAKQPMLQYCAPVDRSFEFPAGDTLLTVRLRDQSGNVGAPRQLIIRVGS